MKPLIFIASTPYKIKLREYIQDLNQEMNFEEIVDFFMKNTLEAIKKNPNNSKKLIALMIDLHGEKEFREILIYNIKSLGINFSHIDRSTSIISGNSYHTERDPDGHQSWLEWFFFDVLDWDQPEISINQNEMDQLNDLEDGEDDE
jgi:hypothetical protein